MPVMIAVPCTACRTQTVPVPANAPGLAAVAVCADCAAKNHTIDHSELLTAQRASRQHAIEKAWADRTPTFYRTHDLIDDPATTARLTQAAASGAAFIAYGPNTQKRSALLWRYAATCGAARGLRSKETGGGEEANTLALATTADFKLIDSIKSDYLNRRYKAVLLDGIGTGRFLNETRRHEEYATLARTMLANQQIPIFTTCFWPPDNPKANPFGIDGSRDLLKWVGTDAAVAFSTLYSRLGILAIDA